MSASPEHSGLSNGALQHPPFSFRHMLKWGLMVGAALLPVALLGLVAIQVASRSASRLVESSNSAAASMAAELVNRELRQSLSLASAAVSIPNLIEAVTLRDEHGVRLQLRPIVQAFPGIDRAFVTDTNGVLWSDFPAAPESLGKNFAQRDWFRGVTSSRQPYVSEVYQRHAEPKPLVVAVAAPFRARDGVVLGILVLQHRLDILTQWIKQLAIGESGYVFLLDQRGTVAAHPRLDLTARVYGEYGSLPLVQDGLRGIARLAAYRDPLTGVPMIAAGAPVQNGSQRWLLIACQPESEAQRPVRLLLYQIGSAAILVAGMAVAVVFTLGRITERNQRLSRQLAAHNEELQRLSLDLARQRTELEVANRELESFSYSVSHDLRAPLLGMDGFSLALMEDYADKLDDQARDYLTRIRTASQRMSTLIDDILRLSRVSRTVMQRTSVDLSAMARTLCEQLRAENPDRSVTVLIQPDVRVDADPSLLAIAMENLLRNAWKFTSRRPKARVEFGVCRRDGKPLYFIRDNGVGFDMAHSGKLFTPFQRLHSKSEFPGTGIGLAIVQRIVRRHGGMVCAEGTPGDGATFYFTL